MHFEATTQSFFQDSHMLKELQEENRMLRETLRLYQANANENAAALRRLRSHELAMLNASSLPELLRQCTVRLASGFGLCSATVVLEDPTQELRRLFLSADAWEPGQAYVQLVPRMSELSAAYKNFHDAYTGPYHGNLHQRLFPPLPQPPRSVALVPFRNHHSQPPISGSLNLASYDPGRYSPGQAGEYLRHLTAVAGACLDNALTHLRLAHSSDTDGLTGCHNRRYLQNRLLEELARAQRNRVSLCCVLFDIDYFKSINDNYGHLAGDQVLVEFSRRIRRQLRINDVFARYGGEEFSALLPETRIDDALRLAERIREKVREPMLLEGQTLNVTVSGGVCEFIPRAHDDDLITLSKRLLNAADEALYQAKAQGRNRVLRAPAVSTAMA